MLLSEPRMGLTPILQLRSEVVMSSRSIEGPKPLALAFEPAEEQWFASARQQKRPFRSSPSVPPPPIGDEMADRWFR
jgi:hypothetical protein